MRSIILFILVLITIGFVWSRVSEIDSDGGSDQFPLRANAIPTPVTGGVAQPASQAEFPQLQMNVGEAGGGVAEVEQPQSVVINPNADGFASPPISITGSVGNVTRISAEGIFDLHVDQQGSDPNYITADPSGATQFSLAARYGTVGILAHNFLAGTTFFGLELNSVIMVEFDNGQQVPYTVKDMQWYQALSPHSPYSDFFNLDGSNEVLTAAQLFNKVYTQGNKLVLQTCFEQNGDLSFGRVFIVAEP